MIKQLHIFDFDGTLIDSSHRYRIMPGTGKIDLQHWVDNEQHADKDTPLPLVSLFQKLAASPDCFVIIATARVWCEKADKVCREYGILPHKIIARAGRQDKRAGATLKLQGIRPLLNLKQFQQLEQIHVWEDNADYLKTLCDTLPHTIGHYIPSKQGH